jgi:hypothetical protein
MRSNEGRLTRLNDERLKMCIVFGLIQLQEILGMPNLTTSWHLLLRGYLKLKMVEEALFKTENDGRGSF